jgi:hypothetical protein
MPYVRHIAAYDHEVSGSEWRNAVTHHTVAAAFEHERELVLRMKVPLGSITASLHNFTVEGLPLALWSVLKHRPCLGGVSHGV